MLPIARVRRAPASVAGLVGLTWLSVIASLSLFAAARASTDDDRARSQAAFVQVAGVLRHPRCINCHTLTQFPRQGDSGKRHAMNVQRGPDNHGTGALKCATCHKDANQPNGVPGAPHWALAPLSMGWEGLDDHHLAEAIKQSATNGGRTLEQLYAHMTSDALVLWAWNPGGKRQPPPVTPEEFARHVRAWIDSGAVSPDPAPPPAEPSTP